jgi:hypothetical protein
LPIATAQAMGLFVENPEPEAEGRGWDVSASSRARKKQEGEGRLAQGRAFLLVTAQLLGVVLAAFAQLLKAGVTNYDDP